jgi:hypothetical protein
VGRCHHHWSADIALGRHLVEHDWLTTIAPLTFHLPLGARGSCVIRFSGPYHDLDVECETHMDGPWNGWVRLKYELTDYWTGEPLEIDDKIFLATSRPPFGGLRWWFVCPHLNRRVRKLYLWGCK